MPQKSKETSVKKFRTIVKNDPVATRYQSHKGAREFASIAETEAHWLACDAERKAKAAAAAQPATKTPKKKS